LRPILAFTVEGSVRRLLVMLMDTSLSMRIKDPRLDAADQKRLALAKGDLDPAKGLNQLMGKGHPVDSTERIDVVKAALKNDRINLLPQLDKEFDLEAFGFAQNVAGLSSRKEAATNAP